VSPLSGVLANHVYNAQLVGRPYLLEMIEDVEIVARFARSQLGAREVAIDAPGEGRLLARAVAAALLDVALVVPVGAEPPFSWKEAVESMRETWPIHYLLPGGVALRHARRDDAMKDPLPRRNRQHQHRLRQASPVCTVTG
jgi:hypothetical protein